MASNTPNLGLLKKDPVADGNETFNIQTMLNDNWDKIDEAVGNINVPEASLTEKGIVQLSNATDGTREDVAATEKAVKAAYNQTVSYIETRDWQKSPLTTNDGRGINLPDGTDLNTVVNIGFYDVNAPLNAPSSIMPVGNWWYLRVERHRFDKPDNRWVTQRITHFYTGLEFIRQSRTLSLNVVVWTRWEPVLNGFSYKPNLVSNSTGLLGFARWTKVNGETGWNYYREAGNRISSFFFDAEPSGVNYRYIESESIPVWSNVYYTLSLDFLNPTNTASEIYAEVLGNGSIIGQVFCDASTEWHRKSYTFNTGSARGVTIRLVVKSDLPKASRGFSRIMLNEGTTEAVWNDDADGSLLFQYANDGKSQIATAISGKGVSASSSDTFTVLANKIGQIPVGGPGAWITGAKISNYITETTTASTTVLGQIPAFKTVMQLSNSGGTTYISMRSGWSGGTASLNMRLQDYRGNTLTILRADQMWGGYVSWDLVSLTLLATPSGVNYFITNSVPYYGDHSEVLKKTNFFSGTANLDVSRPLDIVVQTYDYSSSGYTQAQYGCVYLQPFYQ
jgi:hypothetical protein